MVVSSVDRRLADVLAAVLLLSIVSAALSAVAASEEVGLSSESTAAKRSGHQTSAVTIADPRFHQSLPGQTAAAGYLTITNSGGQSCTLQSVSAARFEGLAIHQHRHEGGVMQMRPVAALTIPAGATVLLAPGGDHLMGKVATPLVAGEPLSVELDFGSCGRQRVTFVVIDPRR